jgi:hypothetical protein
MFDLHRSLMRDADRPPLACEISENKQCGPEQRWLLNFLGEASSLKRCPLDSLSIRFNSK